MSIDVFVGSKASTKCTHTHTKIAFMLRCLPVTIVLKVLLQKLWGEFARARDGTNWTVSWLMWQHTVRRGNKAVTSKRV